MSSLEQSPLRRPDELLQKVAILTASIERRNGALVTSGRRPVPVWQTAAFQSWSKSMSRHSIMVLSGSLKGRPAVQAFLTNAVNCIQDSNVSVTWALRAGIDPALDRTNISFVTVIKYLTYQAMRNSRNHTEKSMSISCQRIKSTRDDDYTEWIKMLAVALSALNTVFIVADADILCRAQAGIPTGLASMKELFTRVFGEMEAIGSPTIVKVLLADYGVTSQPSDPTPQHTTGELLTLNVGGKPVPASRRAVVQRVRGKKAIRDGMQRGMGLRRGR